MRGTSHNGRIGKNGIYSPKHNDRNFDLERAEHIDQSQTNNNWYWHRYEPSEPDLTFEQAESKFYQTYFADSLDAKNRRYITAGHKERTKTMDEYRSNKLSCPEETILQIGKLGDTIEPDLLKQICIEHMNWETKTFPNVKLLDVALHVDEQGAPHLHERKVWIAHSNDGLVVGQSKALKEMGIERPHPEKKKDRHNNPKMTYTAMCREHFLEVCKEHGLELEVDPSETSKNGLDLQEYKLQQEREKLKQAKQERNEIIKQCEQKESELGGIERDIEDLDRARKGIRRELYKTQQELEETQNNKKQADEERKRLKENNEKLQVEYDKMLKQYIQKQAELKRVKADIAKGEDLIRKMGEIKSHETTAPEAMRKFMAKRTEGGKNLLQVFYDEIDREYNQPLNDVKAYMNYFIKTPDKQADQGFEF